jgi:hypothetical protein
MLPLYAHAKGDAMGESFPKRLSWRGLHDRTIAAEESVYAIARPDLLRRFDEAARTGPPEVQGGEEPTPSTSAGTEDR